MRAPQPDTATAFADQQATMVAKVAAAEQAQRALKSAQVNKQGRPPKSANPLQRTPEKIVPFIELLGKPLNSKRSDAELNAFVKKAFDTAEERDYALAYVYNSKKANKLKEARDKWNDHINQGSIDRLMAETGLTYDVFFSTKRASAAQSTPASAASPLQGLAKPALDPINMFKTMQAPPTDFEKVTTELTGLQPPHNFAAMEEDKFNFQNHPNGLNIKLNMLVMNDNEYVKNRKWITPLTMEGATHCAMQLMDVGEAKDYYNDVVGASIALNYGSIPIHDFMAAVPFIPAQMLCYIATLGLKAMTNNAHDQPKPSPYMIDILYDFAMADIKQPPSDERTLLNLTDVPAVRVGMLYHHTFDESIQQLSLSTVAQAAGLKWYRQWQDRLRADSKARLRQGTMLNLQNAIIGMYGQAFDCNFLVLSFASDNSAPKAYRLCFAPDRQYATKVLAILDSKIILPLQPYYEADVDKQAAPKLSAPALSPPRAPQKPLLLPPSQPPNPLPEQQIQIKMLIEDKPPAGSSLAMQSCRMNDVLAAAAIQPAAPKALYGAGKVAGKSFTPGGWA